MAIAWRKTVKKVVFRHAIATFSILCIISGAIIICLFSYVVPTALFLRNDPFTQGSRPLLCCIAPTELIVFPLIFFAR